MVDVQPFQAAVGAQPQRAPQLHAGGDERHARHGREMLPFGLRNHVDRAGRPDVLMPAEIGDGETRLGEVERALDQTRAAVGESDTNAAAERAAPQIVVEHDELGEALTQAADRRVVGDELQARSRLRVVEKRFRHVDVTIDVGDGEAADRA